MGPSKAVDDQIDLSMNSGNQKSQLLHFQKIIKDIQLSELRLGNLSTKFTDSDQEA